MPKRIRRRKKSFRRKFSARSGIRRISTPKHIRHHKKSFRRRLSAWLGIRHTSKKYYLLYFLALIALIFLFPMIMKFLTAFKKNYGRGYGYVPRDFERSEKLREEKEPIPFQPKGAWQYGEIAEEKK